MLFIKAILYVLCRLVESDEVHRRTDGRHTTDDPKNSLEPKVQISETFRTLLYILTFFSKVGLDKHCFSTDLFLAKTMNEIFTSFLIIIERFLY